MFTNTWWELHRRLEFHQENKGMHVGVPGDGASCYNRNAARRRHNQLLMETVSLPTLRHNLMTRGEQTWGFPACSDPDDVYRFWTGIERRGLPLARHGCQSDEQFLFKQIVVTYWINKSSKVYLSFFYFCHLFWWSFPFVPTVFHVSFKSCFFTFHSKVTFFFTLLVNWHILHYFVLQKN